MGVVALFSYTLVVIYPTRTLRVDTESLIGYTNKWVDRTNRGGLFLVTNNFYRYIAREDQILNSRVQTKDQTSHGKISTCESSRSFKVIDYAKLLSSWFGVNVSDIKSKYAGTATTSSTGRSQWSTCRFSTAFGRLHLLEETARTLWLCSWSRSISVFTRAGCLSEKVISG